MAGICPEVQTNLRHSRIKLHDWWDKVSEGRGGGLYLVSSGLHLWCQTWRPQQKKLRSLENHLSDQKKDATNLIRLSREWPPPSVSCVSDPDENTWKEKLKCSSLAWYSSPDVKPVYSRNKLIGPTATTVLSDCMYICVCSFKKKLPLKQGPMVSPLRNSPVLCRPDQSKSHLCF